MPKQNDSVTPAAVDYDKLLKAKVASGLPPADAKNVIAAQRDHDQRLIKRDAARKAAASPE